MVYIYDSGCRRIFKKNVKTKGEHFDGEKGVCGGERKIIKNLKRGRISRNFQEQSTIKVREKKSVEVVLNLL